MTARRAPDVLSAPGIAQLFPGQEQRLSRRPGRGPALLVLPSRRAPRVLVPAGLPSAADMLHRHSTSGLQRLVQAALARSLRSGLLPLLPVSRLTPAPGLASIADHARAHVPGAAQVGVLLGPPRANAKPVLRVFDADGRTVAFGKVGHHDTSARLVRHEAVVLHELADHPFRHLQVPHVIAAADWNGCPVLYQSPLQPAAGQPSWELPLAAMQEVAEACLPGKGGPLVDNSYVSDLRTRIALGPAADELGRSLQLAVERFGDVCLDLGRWHGDWAPWNAGEAAGRCQVWDWERSSCGVPLGFDVVHFVVQRAFSRGAGDPAGLAGRLLAELAPALSRWYTDRAQVAATLELYLLEILQRYLQDSDGAPSPALRHRLAVLRTTLSTLTAPSKEPRADA